MIASFTGLFLLRHMGWYTMTTNTQRITHTHTHTFKVTLIGWGRLTWRSHNKGLSGVDWCVGHSFEMPYVALIKITNIKYTTHPTRHGITVFIVVMGEFLFPWFSLTIQPLN